MKMIMNLTIDVKLKPNLKLTNKNDLVRFKELIVGKIIRYNKRTGVTKIEISDVISAKRILKTPKNPNYGFLNYDIEQ